MNPRLAIALHVLFAVVMLVVGFLLTFPWTSLQRRIEAEVEKAVPGSALAIGEIGPAAPLGVRLGDVVFEKTGNNGQSTKIAVDAIRLRPSFLKLLTGKLGASFDVSLLGGDVKGTLVAGTEAKKIDATIDTLDLAEGGVIEGASGLQLAGTVSGNVALELDPKNLITAGTIDVEVANAMIKGGKVMGFGLPAIDLGTPKLNGTIENGESKDTKLVAKSGDVEANVTLEKLSLRPDLMQSLVTGQARLKLTDSWLNRNPQIKGMMAFAGPMVKNGAIELPLNGTLARPSPLMGGFGR